MSRLNIMSGFEKTADPGDQLVSHDEAFKSGSTMLNPMLLMKSGFIQASMSKIQGLFKYYSRTSKSLYNSFQ